MTEVMEWDKYFYYDETSFSCLKWKIDVYAGKRLSSKMISAGCDAGNIMHRGTKENKRKQILVTVNKQGYAGHRVVWELLNGTIPEGLIVDHLDRNPWNNKIENLKLKTLTQNNRNVSKSTRNTSGMTGVGWHKTKGEVTHAYCCWYYLDGKKGSKYFSLKKYSKSDAWDLAVEKRKAAIDGLNAQGAGYTETHGQ